MDKESAIDKARKLLAKAEAEGVTQAEALLFTEKAVEIMARFGLDKAILDAKNNASNKPGNKIFFIDNPYCRPKAIILAAIAEAFHCEVIIKHETKHQLSLLVVGFQSDIEIVDLIWTSVYLQATSKLVRTEVPWYENTRSFRQSYLLGWGGEVKRRLTPVVQETESGVPGAELVLVSRALAVKSEFDNMFPSVTQIKVRGSSHAGEDQGKKDARNANLHDRTEATAGSKVALQ